MEYFELFALNILNSLFYSSRVFLLGPSHHYYTPKCALSRATVYKNPIGDLPIDVEGIANFFFFASSFVRKNL